MKTKKFKRVLTLVLALAMMLSLSMVAFADGDGQVEVIVRTSSYDLTTHQYSYTQIANLTGVDINTNDTVKDMLNREFTANWSGSYLHGLTVNNVTRSTTRYTPVPGSFDEWDEYVGGDPIIDSLNQLSEFSDLGGIAISQANYLGEGYFQLGDEYSRYFCSITHDWIYEVDYASDGINDFVEPTVTMDQCNLSNGDVVRLTYGLVWKIFMI